MGSGCPRREEAALPMSAQTPRGDAGKDAPEDVPEGGTGIRLMTRPRRTFHPDMSCPDNHLRRTATPWPSRRTSRACRLDSVAAEVEARGPARARRPPVVGDHI